MYQADVEEYLGGPDAEVEESLKGFQDAIAYVMSNFTNFGAMSSCFTKGQQVPIHGRDP